MTRLMKTCSEFAWRGLLLAACIFLLSPRASAQRVLTSGPVTPANGSGSAQVFNFSASHSNGYTNITWISALITSDIGSGAPACQVWFHWSSGTIVLIDDYGGWPSRTLAQGGYLSNSRCQLDVGASSFAGSGQALTLNAAIGFKPVFAGSKNVHMLVSDALGDAGWPAIGTYTVGTQPSVLSVTPNASGAPTPTQTFTVRYWNPNGTGAIDWTQVVFGYPNDTVRSCFIYYGRASNQLQLVTDDGGGYLGPAQPGSQGTLQNSQCRIDLPNSSATVEGNALILRLPLTFFSPQYKGQFNIYAWHHDTVSNQTSPAVPLGTWTAFTALPDPPVGTLSPASGSGASSTFTVTGSSVNGNYYVTWMGGPLFTADINSGAPRCSVWHRAGSNQIILVDDSGNWPGKTLGQPETLTNGQCQVNAGASTATAVGNTVTLNAAIAFQPGYAGAKNVHLLVGDRKQDTGWPQKGTWTVPGQQYYLTTGVGPAGGGSILRASGWYNSGAVVTVTATANPGYQFMGFSGSLGGTTNPQNLVMNAAMSVTANFSPVPTQYQLTTGVSPSGGGAITPNCSAGCLYNGGQVVTITATPSPGYVFTGYSGSLSGTVNPQSLTMNGVASITANFTNTVIATSLSDFQSCIGSAGLVTNCVLAQDRYGGEHAPAHPAFRHQRDGWRGTRGHHPVSE